MQVVYSDPHEHQQLYKAYTETLYIDHSETFPLVQLRLLQLLCILSLRTLLI